MNTLETRAVLGDDEQPAGLPADGDVGDGNVSADVEDAVEEGLPAPPLIPNRYPSGAIQDKNSEILSTPFDQLGAEFAVDAARYPDVVNKRGRLQRGHLACRGTL